MPKKRQFVSSILSPIGNLLHIDIVYFLKNSLWVGAGQLFITFSGLFTSLIFARMLNKEVFGQYQFILSLIAIISIFSIPGLSTAIIRSIANKKDGCYRPIIRKSFYYSLFGSFILLLIGLYYLLANNEALLGGSIIISGLFLPFIYPFNKWIALLFGKEKYNLHTRWTAIQLFVQLAGYLLILSLFKDINILLFILIYLLFTTLFNQIYFWKSLKFINNDRDDKETLKYGKFITGINLVSLITAHFEKIVLGIINIEVLANYAIILSLITAIKSFLKGIFIIVLPRLAKQKVHLQPIHLITITIMGIITSLILFLSSGIIFDLLLDGKFNEVEPFFRKTLIIVPLLFIGGLLGNKALADKAKKQILLINMIPPLVAVALSTILFIITKDVEIFIFSKIFTSSFLYAIIALKYMITKKI